MSLNDESPDERLKRFMREGGSWVAKRNPEAPAASATA